MKAIITILVLLSFITDPGKISRVNTLKEEARKAFNTGDYSTAIEKYKMLVDSLEITEDEVKLNLANAYYQQNDTTQAYSSYQQVASSTNTAIRSKANQQLGLLQNKQGKFEEALNHFKQAIKADPANMDARYNYEMLKKKLDEEKKKEEQQKDQNKQQDQKKDQQQEQKDQQNKDEQQKKDDQQKKDSDKKSENKDEQSKEEQQKKEEQAKKEQEEKESEKPSEEKKEVPPSVSEKLQQMKISEEKAKMLLEAMKNQEVQYLQQNKRKATKPKEKGKPDW